MSEIEVHVGTTGTEAGEIGYFKFDVTFNSSTNQFVTTSDSKFYATTNFTLEYRLNYDLFLTLNLVDKFGDTNTTFTTTVLARLPQQTQYTAGTYTLLQTIPPWYTAASSGQSVGNKLIFLNHKNSGQALVQGERATIYYATRAAATGYIGPRYLTSSIPMSSLNVSFDSGSTYSEVNTITGTVLGECQGNESGQSVSGTFGVKVYDHYNTTSTWTRHSGDCLEINGSSVNFNAPRSTSESHWSNYTVRSSWSSSYDGTVSNTFGYYVGINFDATVGSYNYGDNFSAPYTLGQVGYPNPTISVPGTTTISEVSTAANVSIETGSIAPSVAFTIYYRRKANSGWENAWTQSNTGFGSTTVTVAVAGITTNTKYIYFKVVSNGGREAQGYTTRQKTTLTLTIVSPTTTPIQLDPNEDLRITLNVAGNDPNTDYDIAYKDTYGVTSYTLIDDGTGNGNIICTVPGIHFDDVRKEYMTRTFRCTTRTGGFTATVSRTICLKPGCAHVRANGKWYAARPYVYNSGWRIADSYVRDNSDPSHPWNLTGE